MIRISGTVEEVVFYNEDNGYAVFDIDAGGDYVTCVGTLPYISAGESVTLAGDYTNHPVYGKQFSVSSFEKAAPDNVNAIYKYLSSGLIKGIRSVTAKKIVDLFGENSLDIIENQPERLAQIKGISIKRALEINVSYIKQFGMRNLAIFLQDNGISPNFAGKIYKKYGSSAVEKIKRNPYVLAKDIHGIGFKKADALAMKTGVNRDDTHRIQAGISYCLNEYTMSGGNTYCPSDFLINKTSALLEVDVSLVSNSLNALIFEKTVIAERAEKGLNITLCHSISQR